jgi:hypothetical protein
MVSASNHVERVCWKILIRQNGDRLEGSLVGFGVPLPNGPEIIPDRCKVIFRWVAVLSAFQVLLAIM